MKGSKRFNWERLSEFLESRFSRKRFLQVLGLGALWAGSSGRWGRKAWAKVGNSVLPRTPRAVNTQCHLAVVKGDDPAAITRKAVELLGGIQLFVRHGDVVVIKPNIGWDRTPEQAANTNPEVLTALVQLCKDAGAKLVKVFDNTCNDSRRTYQNSGIHDAVKKAGALVFTVSNWKFNPGSFPAGSLMQEWPIYRDAVECDCFINVPIAKHHGLTQLSLSMKNLMGVCGGWRGQMHQDIDRKLAEVTQFIRPNLTVVDAYRILLRNGPTGGNLADVVLKKTVLASADPVLADAYATTLFDMQPQDIGYITAGAKLGLGSMDLAAAHIRRHQI